MNFLCIIKLFIRFVDKFEGFESKCLEFKSLLTMRGPLGRVRTVSAMVIIFNCFTLYNINRSQGGMYENSGTPIL